MAKILIAEDDLSTRSFLASSLEKAGHSVIAFGDGLEAMREIELNGGSYDLLLTDIVMPGMDGVELSTKAGAIYPSLKIMFITGFAGMALGRPDAQSADAKVISKPFHLGNLTQEIQEILKR